MTSMKTILSQPCLRRQTFTMPIYEGEIRKEKNFALPVFMTKIVHKATVKVKKILRNDINEQNFSMLASLT